MSRQFVTRLVLAVSLLGALAACGTSPTAPQSPESQKVHDGPWPWW